MRRLTLNDAGELLDPDGYHSVFCECSQCDEDDPSNYIDPDAAEDDRKAGL